MALIIAGVSHSFYFPHLQIFVALFSSFSSAVHRIVQAQRVNTTSYLETMTPPGSLRWLQVPKTQSSLHTHVRKSIRQIISYHYFQNGEKFNFYCLFVELIFEKAS